MKKITIAIDGHSSCGKSTMAKDLAKMVGYVYVDTGAMYRAVTLAAMRGGMFGENGSLDTERLKAAVNDIDISFRRDETTGKVETYLNGENVEREIRTIDVSQHVSQVAALPFVRERLVAAQQAMGREKGVVMDGRDIGLRFSLRLQLRFVHAVASRSLRQRECLPTMTPSSRMCSSATMPTLTVRCRRSVRQTTPSSSTIRSLPLTSRESGCLRSLRNVQNK